MSRSAQRSSFRKFGDRSTLGRSSTYRASFNVTHHQPTPTSRTSPPHSHSSPNKKHFHVLPAYPKFEITSYVTYFRLWALIKPRSIPIGAKKMTKINKIRTIGKIVRYSDDSHWMDGDVATTDISDEIRVQSKNSKTTRVTELKLHKIQWAVAIR